MVTSLENAAAILGRETPDASDEKSVFRISQQLHAQLAGPLLVCYGDSHFCYTDDEASVICVFSYLTPRSALFSHYRDTVATGFIRSFINDDDPTTLLKAVSACREIAAQSTAFLQPGVVQRTGGKNGLREKVSLFLSVSWSDALFYNIRITAKKSGHGGRPVKQKSQRLKSAGFHFVQARAVRDCLLRLQWAFFSFGLKFFLRYGSSCLRICFYTGVAPSSHRAALHSAVFLRRGRPTNFLQNSFYFLLPF